MLKIGDFSKLANVTVKALRLYAEMGLLAPAWVDRFTSYRYYTLDQLPRLNRILALKELGLSLEQIRRVLESELTAEELRGMFHLKQAEIQQRLTEEQLRLARIEARLKQIEQEGHLDVEAVVVRPVEALTFAYTRVVAPTPEDLPARKEEARQTISRVLSQNNIQIVGPWLVINRSNEYQEQNIALEVGYLVAVPLRLPSPVFGAVSFRRLPALPAVAVYAHAGPPEALPQAYATLFGWAETNLYRVCGPAREIYWNDTGEVDLSREVPGSIRTNHPTTFSGQMIEVQLPVEPLTFQKEAVMEPEIIEYREVLVAGSEYTGTNEHNEISQLWANEFMPRIHEFKRVDNAITYGVCYEDEGLPPGQFRYIAAAEIARPEDAPPGMTVTRIPAGKYAVFKHVGSLQELVKTNEYIHHVWLPRSGHKQTKAPDLEVYTPEFNDFSPDSVLYLYIPIE